eukprot:3941408-Rhodomonas_salina.1
MCVLPELGAYRCQVFESGTKVEREPLSLEREVRTSLACYAFAMRCPVLTQAATPLLLCVSYAVSGTEVGTIRWTSESELESTGRIRYVPLLCTMHCVVLILRMLCDVLCSVRYRPSVCCATCYAMRGTDLAYAAQCVMDGTGVCYAVCSTDLAHATLCAMPCSTDLRVHTDLAYAATRVMLLNLPEVVTAHEVHPRP